MATVTHLGLLPFCFSSSAASGGYGSGTLGTSSPYPIGLNVQTLLRWYWLVKRWTVSATLTGTGSRDTPISTSFEDTFFNGNNNSPELTTEKQLVCGRSAQYPKNDPAFLGFFPASMLMFNEGVQEVDELYYPSLSLGYVNGAGSIQTSLTEFGGNIPGGTITMDEIELPSYFQSILYPNNGPSSGSITITASEYWPYDPGDGGGPIYDSGTGAQLRDF